MNFRQKNLNDFKKEQQDFQNEQRNFQNMMLNMFKKQMGNNNTSSSGTLPSNTITNPRCEARAITTRSGLSYTPVPPIPPPLYDENEPLTEKETEVTKDKVLPSTKDIQPPVIQKSHDPVKPIGSPMSPEPSSAQIDNSPPSKESSKETKLPYPSRVDHEKKGENDKVQIQKFWEMFKKIHVDITLADALILMPKYQKMLKSLLSNKEKLNEMANTPVSETCSAIILKKLPEKLGDPGQLTLIPCNFSDLNAKDLSRPSVPKGIARDVLTRTARSLNRSPWGRAMIRDGMERIVSNRMVVQDKESIQNDDIYDTGSKMFYENFFEMNDKKVEFLERKTKEDFETQDEPKKKKELQGKVFDPGITFHEKSFEKDDKSSKELAPSKALLTLDVFDPLHPPLMDFHVTKAFSGFTFSILKIFSKKFVAPGIKMLLISIQP
ncbi:hypothetical protein Tco_0873805 [Tanacetum coccineum]|uniref:Reverse transcriptase domain-containing protein n=1 Tax=Tanacetum coccineum TaxID=301880 RepID=A0ABQ5BQH5_9ASTR